MEFARRYLWGCLKICLLILIGLFPVEVFFYFFEDYVFLGEGSGTIDSIQWPSNTEEFLQGEEFRTFDYQEVDENWIDHYSEGEHSLALR